MDSVVVPDVSSALASPGWLSAWIADIGTRGGVPVRLPAGVLTNELGFDAAGDLAAQYPVPSGNAPYTYELAPLSVRLYDLYDRSIADIRLGFTTAMASAGITSAADAVEPGLTMANNALNNAAGGSAAGAALKLVPWWAWVAGGVVGYGALVQAGIVPPLRDVFKHHAKA